MVGGGLLSRRPATLSGDGKLLLCPCGRLVNIYSAVTGERVGVLAGHMDEVTGVVLDPKNADLAYTCSLDCSVRLWDYRAGEEVRRLVVREPVKHMVIHQELGVAYFSVQLREGGGRVMLYNILTGKFSGNALKTRAAAPLVLSPRGTLAATFDRHSLFVWRTGNEIYRPLNLHHTKPYTCLAISSDDSLIAAGDVSGRILIWRAFEHSVPSALRDGERSGKAHPPIQPPVTTLHWHAHPVGALTFSQDGTYLLSGGQEGVLVIWQLDSNRRNFLPRLGGPIIGLHPSPADPAKYLLRQADNVVRVVNAATMKVEVSVVGLQPAAAGLVPAPAGAGGGAVALLAPGVSVSGAAGGSGVLVLACEHAQIQLYDIERNRHLQLLQIIPRNAVSATEPRASLDSPAPPYVSLLAFSRDGSVLATVDVRPDGGPYGSAEACLKFWDSSCTTAAPAGAGSGSKSEAAAPFTLNTRVDEPHREVVTSLAYSPCRHMAVTTGGCWMDADFKVWVLERRRPEVDGSDRRPGGGGGSAAPATSWRCRSTGGYKGLPLAAAAFSADGSVLALAAASRVTLWDAESSALAAVLPAATAAAAGPAGAAPLTQLTFVPGTPFLAAASPSCLTVYNLLTAAVHWCLPLHAMSISADAAYGLLAVALPVAAELPQQTPAAATGATAGTAGAPPTTPGPAAAAATGTALAAGRAPADGKGMAVAATAAPAPATAGTGGKGATPRHPPRLPPPRRAQPSCHVVIFDPQDATPRYHCHVPGAVHVHISHLPPPAGAAGPAGGSAAGMEGSSPILILRDNRQYTVAAPPSSKTVYDAAPSVTPLERDQVLSAFEAAFGRPTGQSDAAAGGGGGATPMDLDAASLGAAAAAAGGDGDTANVGGRPVWAALFDAPSHALPPPTTLATAFLTLLTTGET